MGDATGRLHFGADGSMIERTNQLVVVIGTPVDEFLGPSMTVFEKAVNQIAPHLRDGALVVAVRLRRNSPPAAGAR